MSDHVVETFDVVLVIRLIDMANMCNALAKNCDERKRDKLGRRFKRAASSFSSMLEEIKNDSRQQKLL